MSEPAGTPATTTTLMPGATVGSYTVERKLGAGGMADVFFAIHNELNRPAALKVLRPSLATDEVHLSRFMQEARAAAALIHPNIVQVYDVGREGEHRYIAQEYIPGSNLKQYLSSELAPLADEQDDASADEPANEDRQLPLNETLSILLQVLSALNKSANSGIVHRDIKPENIMLTIDGEVKVADFGLARVLLGDDPHLTRAGTTLGTPMYMSPEQIQEGEVDIRSDLYSLGVTLYHMLAGRTPFTGETPLALAMQHVQAPLPDIRRFRKDLPESLAALVDRLLAKDPADRFASPREVTNYLREHRAGDLAHCWPDQTVPLPDAAANTSTTPLQATLALRAQLSKRYSRWSGKAAALAVMIGVLIASFAFGRVLTNKDQRLFAKASNDASEDIQEFPKQESAKQQYLAALLDDRDDPQKWLAVEQNYPADDNGVQYRENSVWIKLAQLQLARHNATINPESASRTLTRFTRSKSTTSFDLLIRVLAALELAQMPQTENGATPTKWVSDAHAVYAAEPIDDADKRAIDQYVKMVLPASLREIWNAAANK